jgi:uncharacterized protein YoxC
MLGQIDLISEGFRGLVIFFVVSFIIRISRNIVLELKELNKKLSGLEKQLVAINDELIDDHRFNGVKKNLNAIARDVSCLDNHLENICEAVSHINSDLSDIKDGVNNICSDVDDRRSC